MARLKQKVESSQEIIRRSRLIIPVNVKKFIKKAYLRNADAIVLDLEDSIPLTQKKEARSMVSESIPLVAKGGSDVLVRINHLTDDTHLDLEESIWPGLNGIILPKVETGEQVKDIDRLITSLEEKRSIEKGSVKIGILIETAKGYLDVNQIAKASPRIDSITLGVEDFALDAGFTPDHLGVEFKTFLANISIVCHANNIMPMGLMGSIANYQDLNSLKKIARDAYYCGYQGSSCIHPSQVPILNECFSSSIEELEISKKIVDVFQESISKGRASSSLDGKMIDYPIYYRALRMIERQNKINDIEKKKQVARETA